MLSKLIQQPQKTSGRNISTSWPSNEKYARIRTETYACYLEKLKTMAFVNIPLDPLVKKLGVSESSICSAFGISPKNYDKSKGSRTEQSQQAILAGLQEHINDLQKKGTVIDQIALDNLKIGDVRSIRTETYAYYLEKLKTRAFVNIPLVPLAKKLGVSISQIYTAFGISYVNYDKTKGSKIEQLQQAILAGLQEHINDLQKKGTAIDPVVLTNLQITNASHTAGASRGYYRLSLHLTSPRANWFETRPVYIINGKSFSHAQIQRFVKANQQQVYVDNVWVDIPLDIFRYMQKCLRKWAKQIDEDAYGLPPPGAASLLGGMPKKMTDILQKEEYLEEILDGLHRTGKPGVVSLPKGLAEPVHTYQEQGYQWLYFLQRHGFGGILADDMGVGKTLQTLLLLAKLKQTGRLAKPALIVMPKTALSWQIWEKEGARFLPGQFKILTISGSARERAAQIKTSAKYDIAVTSYPALCADREIYSAQEFSGLILDEAQTIKNPKTRYARTVKNQSLVKASWRLALSGTPIENSLYDLWSIFDFLMPGFLGDNKNQFAKLFGHEDANKLRKVIYPFILRRTLPDTNPHLPASRTIHLPYALSPAESNIYNGLVDKQNKLKGIDQVKEFFKYSMLLQQVCNHIEYLPEYFNKKAMVKSSKFQLFNELLQKKLRNPENKIVIFSKWPSTLKIIAKYLQEQRIDSLHLYGDDASDDREAAIRKFNGDPKQRIFLCSLMAGSTGIPLTAANVAIHYDLWWNPAVDNQATARVLRPGQTREVEIYYLYAKDTIETNILVTQKRKYELINKVLGKDSLDGKDFTQEIWESFFWDKNESSDNP
ncbi:MAG: DEAD/DEAH box helicase [Candidatus Margulisbacteria bacterium]|jgi:hypothetical protein|nr:DEAD/DEAH box helicase [Candidatus Margulisiibacteriota bacterium]